MDFTLDKYRAILESARGSGYRICSVIDWWDDPRKSGPALPLRHDVDRNPENALAMATLEARLGVTSSYYFRVLPGTFVPSIIRRVHDLGHEIGYHYEDWHLAKYDSQAAIGLFQTHLRRMREIAPVRSIAMHGSPLARESNMTIWDHYDFRQDGVIDAVMTIDYAGFSYFTDSGRTFGASRANLRDYISGVETPPGVHTSDDLARYLAERRSERIHLNIHPERWNDMRVGWLKQLGRDTAANAAKHALRLMRQGLEQRHRGTMSAPTAVRSRHETQERR
jgi:hypothetical protein